MHAKFDWDLKRLLNPGDHDAGETPVPIPNTEAKPCGADGTARAAEWESRTLPGFFLFFNGRKASRKPRPASTSDLEKEPGAKALPVMWHTPFLFLARILFYQEPPT
jgi:hypothetical protein